MRSRKITLPCERHAIRPCILLDIAGNRIVERKTLVRYGRKRLHLFKARIGERRTENNLPILIAAACDIKCCHFQLALNLRDIVERGVRTALKRIGERIPALALLGLRTGKDISCAILTDKSVSADFNLVRCELLAVIDLRITL